MPQQILPIPQQDLSEQDRLHEPVPPPALLPQHAAALAASAISAEVIAARGYRSVTSRAEMERLGFGPKQCLVPTLVMPIWNVFGELSFYVHRPDTPRMRSGKPTKYEIPAGAKVAVDVHPQLTQLIRNPSVPLFITEGTKKADAAISLGLCCLSLIGVWNWRGTNEWGGKTTLPDWDGIALKGTGNKGRPVYLVFDSDVMLKRPVQMALARLSEFLAAKGADVAFIYLPAGRGGQKTGLDDYLADGHSLDDLLRLSTKLLREIPAGEDEGEDDYAKNSDGLPWIETRGPGGRQLRHVSLEALEALVDKNTPPRLFVRGGKLTRLQFDENKRATLAELGVAPLRGMLARSANFIATTRQGGVTAIAPPPQVVEDILGLPSWPKLPPLAGLVTAPVVSDTGQLITEPGYNPAAKLFYHAAERFRLPDTEPTPQNVVAARTLLDDLLADFPFADAASRAHAWALLLLPFVRPLVDGPTPLHLIDAPQAGTGKTLLAQALSGVFLPGGANVKAPPSKDEEWTKVITSVLRSGASHLLLDNVRLVNSKDLFSVLTSKSWEDRLLGGSEMVVYPNRLVWMITCNNIAGSDELVRRSVWIRLDAGVEQPEERREFRHADLHGYIKDSRPELLGAVMTLLRSWLEAGRPAYSGTLPPVGSFESWTGVMGGLLEHLGVDGFLANRGDLRSRADKDTSAWLGFVEAWWDAHGGSLVSAGELFGLANEWMPERLGDGQERSQKTKLGNLLRSHVDRIYGGRKLVAGGKMTSGSSKGAAAFQLMEIGPASKASSTRDVEAEPARLSQEAESTMPQEAEITEAPVDISEGIDSLEDEDADEWETL